MIQWSRVRFRCLSLAFSHNCLYQSFPSDQHHTSFDFLNLTLSSLSSDTKQGQEGPDRLSPQKRPLKQTGLDFSVIVAKWTKCISLSLDHKHLPRCRFAKFPVFTRLFAFHRKFWDTLWKFLGKCHMHNWFLSKQGYRDVNTWVCRGVTLSLCLFAEEEEEQLFSELDELSWLRRRKKRAVSLWSHLSLK